MDKRPIAFPYKSSFDDYYSTRLTFNNNTPEIYKNVATPTEAPWSGTVVFSITPMINITEKQYIEIRFRATIDNANSSYLKKYGCVQPRVYGDYTLGVSFRGLAMYKTDVKIEPNKIYSFSIIGSESLNKTTTIKVYLNGILVLERTEKPKNVGNYIQDYTVNPYVYMFWSTNIADISGQQFNVYNLRFYKRMLTEQEMLDDFKIDKQRFGIT